MEGACSSLEHWQGYSSLIWKHYLREEGGASGASYLWETEAAANEGHGEEWHEMVEQRTGSRPKFKYFFVDMILDHLNGAVTGDPLKISAG